MSQKLVVAKTQRSKRALAEREPKLVENTKKGLLIKGPTSSNVVHTALKDLYNLKKPDGKLFQKKNLTRPFEDPGSVEFLSKQNDCSLFAYASHSKKRPHNLVFGRMFDYQLLDMVECGIDHTTFKSMSDFESQRNAVVRMGGKPMFVFKGDFDVNPDLGKLKNLLLDFFRGEVVEKLNLAGLDRVIVVTAHKEKVFFRHYGVVMKKSGSKYPKADLQLVGPSMDLTIRRAKYAPEEMQKRAMQQARLGPSAKNKKNMSKGALGDKMGRVHMERQEFDKIALAKMKGLKKRKISDIQDFDEDDSEASSD